MSGASRSSEPSPPRTNTGTKEDVGWHAASCLHAPASPCGEEVGKIRDRVGQIISWKKSQ